MASARARAIRSFRGAVSNWPTGQKGMVGESVDGKGVEEFCANEPHSGTADSPHSLEACENLADKKGFCEWVSNDECNHGHFFLGVGEGVRNCYILWTTENDIFLF